MLGNDKRNYIRMDSLHLLDYVTINKDGIQTIHSMGRTLDVSENGLKLEVTQALFPGDTLLITIGIQDNLIDLIGEVKYSKQKDGNYVLGIEFSDISDEGIRILTIYIIAFNKQFG